jgi:hypothetical protein
MEQQQFNLKTADIHELLKLQLQTIQRVQQDQQNLKALEQEIVKRVEEFKPKAAE